jgi:hypothetical protein
MTKNFVQMPRTEIHIHAQEVTGPFEAWRHTIGHGGVNSRPLPEKIITATRKLQPRLIRIVLQEYFDVYPGHGVFMCFNHLLPGLKRLSAYRIDEVCHWSLETAELLPYEQRMIDTLSEFEYQFYSPADSVLGVMLEEMPC